MTTYTTPQGISDYLPNDTKILNANIIKLQSLFSENGFNQIKTPTIEFAENLEKGLGPIQKKHSIEFFDPAGNRLLLRPDNTTPIARTVATRMNSESTPLKLCYTEPIFRKSNQNHSDTEIFQAGCEIFGYTNLTSIVDIISTCIKGLETLNVTDIGIDIGHINFMKGLSEEKKEALLKGDYITYGKIPERSETIDPDSENLTSLVTNLKKSHSTTPIMINQGLVKGLHYYSGIIFEAYSKHNRNIIASGGQYDTLCAQFGHSLSAVGFAINLNEIGFQDD